jgi:uncharacterized damage-inducible protein DinB
MNKYIQSQTNRRDFLRTSAGVISGLTLLPQGAAGYLIPPPDSIHIIGPIAGYSPQVGTLVTMLNWMQDSLLNVTTGLSQQELDFLFDSKANTIGALIMHMAAIEVIYQDMTFYGLKDLSESNQKKWKVAMDLGQTAQQQIKGKPLEYYLEQVNEVRVKTLSEFKKRDDGWLSKVDPAFFDNQPTNNYCKWFHVVEHIANHRGQISWIRNRLPAAKADKD